MAIKDALLAEFDHEMAVTRRLLERVPFDDKDWKPHQKSMSLGQLATHVADLPGWAPVLLRQRGFDTAAVGAGPEARHESPAALVKSFDALVRAARELIADTSDGQFMEPWTLKEHGRELFTTPRVGIVRSFLLNHSIHHRGQLSVYLRLRDVAVPSIYGPSADER
jgi:uncharacterized damage-inducible protein DinB